MIPVPNFPVKYGKERTEQIQNVASMLILHRKDVSLGQYGTPHDCVPSRCGPYTCEFNIPNLQVQMRGKKNNFFSPARPGHVQSVCLRV
jgi:hypothetical protein